jgi:hypothetical protein
MTQLFTLANQIPVQSSGTPYGASRLYFFRAGTTTHQAVYTTAALNVAHDQPVEADADGVFPPIFINPIADYDYRYQLKTSADALIEDFDNYPRTGLVAGTGVRYARTSSEIAAGVTPVNYYIKPYQALRYGTATSATIQLCIDATPDGETCVIDPVEWTMTVTAEGPQDWITAESDPALDIPSNTAIAILSRRDLTIYARGATFNCDDEYTIAMYRSVNCDWIGGNFVGDTAYKTSGNEASAILVARCLNCTVSRAEAATFYRNIFFIRSSWCSAERCRSTDGGYFSFYATGSLDIDLDDEPSVEGEASWTRFVLCTAHGSKYGNYFLETAVAQNCSSSDCGRQGVFAAHVQTNNAPYGWIDGTISESSNQNSGDVVDGVINSASGSFVIGGTAGVNGTRITGGTIRGCRKAIEVIAADRTTIANVDIADYYLTGISCYTRQISGSDARQRGTVITGNTVGAFNSSSTLTASGYDKKAAIQADSGDSVAIAAVIVGNYIDGNNAGGITPSGTAYEIACNTSGVEIGDNRIRGTLTQQRTARMKKVNATRDMTTATGTQAVTGVGFKPSYIHFYYGVTDATYGGVGVADTSNGAAFVSRHAVTTDSFVTDGTNSIVVFQTAGNEYLGVLQSMDEDGFTISWTKVGSPTGTLQIRAVCIR